MTGLLMLIFLPLGFLGFRALQHHHRTDLFNRVAFRFQRAMVRPSGLFQEAQLVLSHHSPRPHLGGEAGDWVTARVMMLGTEEKNPRTSLTLTHHCVAPALRLKPQGLLNTVADMLGEKDILIGERYFDTDYRITGQPTACVVRALTKEAQRCVQHLETLALVTLSPTEFHVTVHQLHPTEDDLAAFIQAALECFDALIVGYTQPFRQVAKARGLAFTPTEDPIGFLLTGQVEAVPLVIRFVAKGGTLSIEADWQAARTLGRFHIVHIDHAHTEDRGGPLPLHHPVLDRMLAVRILTGATPEVLRQHLQRPDMAEGLLPVLHGYPGSHLNDQQLRLVTNEVSAEQLERVLDEVVAAVKVISRPVGEFRSQTPG